MAETWTKLLSSITDSSVWSEDDKTLRVWIAMMAMADRDGYVWASVDGLARRAMVTEEQAAAALLTFESPDPKSRSKEHEGRRIETVDRGWLLLNHTRFRDMRDEDEHRKKERERKRAQRAAAKAEREEAAKVAPLPPAPTNIWDGSPNETIAPANLAEQAEAILPDLVRGLRGATLEQVRESVGRCATHYILGRGMGQKRRFWMRIVRGWVTDDHGAGKLGTKAKAPRNNSTALHERAERMRAEEQAAKERAAE